MKILLIGYGNMGKTIEQMARHRGHEVAGIIDKDNTQDLHQFSGDNADVAIEFTHPEAAFHNISYCLTHGIPIVSGSTGWLDQLPEVKRICAENQGAFFYASNYSVGVNLFFHLNEYLASLLKRYPGYQVRMKEIHHTQKVDKPSGTAITLAEGILPYQPQVKGWTVDNEKGAEYLHIFSERVDQVVGTHIVSYDSEVDTIEIGHVAHSRAGFAEGAVLAAEWLQHREGVFGMKDLLNLGG
ncbi:4-hydroxy-tetrahydrodipicolinate reductase [soil metagenome]